MTAAAIIVCRPDCAECEHPSPLSIAQARSHHDWCSRSRAQGGNHAPSRNTVLTPLGHQAALLSTLSRIERREWRA